MRTARWWVLTLAFILGCGASPEDSPDTGGNFSGGGGTGGSATNANGGSAPTGGSNPAGSPNGGTMGGVANGLGGALPGGGVMAGMPGNDGGSTAGMPAGGSPSAGSAGEGRAGRGGMAGAAGKANGGSGGKGAGVMGGSGGSVAGGSGGSGACVKNLGCKLSPPPSTGDLHQDCVDRINQFRTQCACLPPLARRMDGEACADRMAEYDAGKNDAHAGLGDNICQPGGSQNECPGYSSNNQVVSLCMQQMWDEGPPPMTPCSGDCFQKHGHFINMTSTTVTRVACGFHTTAAGKVWSVQNFTR